MISAKEKVRSILDRLSDDSTLEDIMYHIYVQEKIEGGGFLMLTKGGS